MPFPFGGNLVCFQTAVPAGIRLPPPRSRRIHVCLIDGNHAAPPPTHRDWTDRGGMERTSDSPRFLEPAIAHRFDREGDGTILEWLLSIFKKKRQRPVARERRWFLVILGADGCMRAPERHSMGSRPTPALALLRPRGPQARAIPVARDFGAYLGPIPALKRST